VIHRSRNRRLVCPHPLDAAWSATPYGAPDPRPSTGHPDILRNKARHAFAAPASSMYRPVGTSLPASAPQLMQPIVG